MARIESDREDILREATALTERIELRLPGDSEPAVVGFRSHGAASFYFSPDFVLHFNTQGELRRAYDRGSLLKAETGKLIRLSRQRQVDAVTLASHPLSESDQCEFIERSSQALNALCEALEKKSVQPGRQVPEDADVLAHVLQWLESHRAPLRIADRPNVE